MSKLERAAAECLDRLAGGEATLEECLAGYPEYAAELRPLLTAANKLESARLVRPTPLLKTRMRAQLTAYMRSNPRQPRPSRWSGWQLRGLGLAFGHVFNSALNTAAVLLLCLATVTVLAQVALPGDALYGWKTASEQFWRAVHFDPLQTDLLLADRRADELTRVAGDPQAESLARQRYQQSLDTLTGYIAPNSQEFISAALIEQKENLVQAGVSMPELDRFLTYLGVHEARLQLDNKMAAVVNGIVTYTLTLSNTGPTSPVSATLATQLSPAEKLVSMSQAACRVAAQGMVSCPVNGLTTEQPYRLLLTTAVDRCYTGGISNTTTITMADNIVNTNATDSFVVSSILTAPYPRYAEVVYVQSNGSTHSLGLGISDNRLINKDLHLRAAAPAWSPDGTRLAFFGEQGISELGGVYQEGNGVWMIDLSNGQAQNPRLLVAQDHVKNIAWSPDGTKLAFEVGPPGITHEIMVVKAQSGQPLNRFAGEQPAWSFDSQKLVIKACMPKCGLWLVDVKGRADRRLTFEDGDSYPAWSPTGQYLAFSSRRDDDWEIYLLRLADGVLRRLTNRPGSDTTPVFGPCGENVYLRTDAYGSWWITVMKSDGSDERKILEGVGPSEDWGLARPAVR